MHYQLLQSMESSKYNPLTWIYGLYSAAYNHFGWMTASAVEQKLNEHYHRISKSNGEIFTGILEGTYIFVNNMQEDGGKVRDTIEQTNENIAEFKKTNIKKITQLDHKSSLTKTIFKKVFNDLKKTTLQRLSNSRALINELDKKSLLASQFNQENLIINNKNINKIKERFKYEMQILYLSRKKQHEEELEDLRNLRAGNHEFQEEVKNNIIGLQQNIQVNNEKNEQEIKGILQNLQKNLLALQEVTDKLINRPTIKPFAQKNSYFVDNIFTLPNIANAELTNRGSHGIKNAGLRDGFSDI